MHSSRGLLADTSAVAQVEGPHKATAESAPSPGEAAREEQLTHPEAGAAPPAAAAASSQQGAAPVRREAEGAGRAAATDSESDDDEDIGPDDWDDLLAVWMTAVGLPKLGEDAQPDSVSEASESSSEDEAPSGM